MFKNMLFNRGGKMRGGGFLLPLLLFLGTEDDNLTVLVSVNEIDRWKGDLW